MVLDFWDRISEKRLIGSGERFVVFDSKHKSRLTSFGRLLSLFNNKVGIRKFLLIDVSKSENGENSKSLKQTETFDETVTFPSFRYLADSVR